MAPVEQEAYPATVILRTSTSRRLLLLTCAAASLGACVRTTTVDLSLGSAGTGGVPATLIHAADGCPIAQALLSVDGVAIDVSCVGDSKRNRCVLLLAPGRRALGLHTGVGQRTLRFTAVPGGSYRTRCVQVGESDARPGDPSQWGLQPYRTTSFQLQVVDDRSGAVVAP